MQIKFNFTEFAKTFRDSLEVTCSSFKTKAPYKTKSSRGYSKFYNYP